MILSAETKSQGEIESVGHEVAHRIAHEKFQGRVRILCEIIRDVRRQDDAREKGIDIHAQSPAYDVGGTRCLDRRFLDARQMRTDLFVEAPAFACEGQ